MGLTLAAGFQGPLIPCLHGDPIAGSNPGGGSDPSSGVALTRVYTVIPFTEQTLQLGQIGRELGVYITKFRALATHCACMCTYHTQSYILP